MRFTALVVVVVAVASLFGVGCSSSSSNHSDLGGLPVGLPDGGAPDLATNPLVDARPYGSYVPSSYDGSKPYPLVILLHGFGATGALQNAYFGLDLAAEEKGFLLAYPDGTVNDGGQRFWDAAEACCRFASPAVDDVAYLNAVIDDMSARYRVDMTRIYFVGHSNGGFMSHRMACDAARRVAGIVSLAGTLDADDSRCMPADGVAILQVHGDADAVIQYAGASNIGRAYKGARDTVAAWATRNGCTGTLGATGQTLDLDTSLAGAETAVERYSTCARGAVELWTIRGGSHTPSFGHPVWANSLFDWLSAFKKAQ
jgi:polyhydroxybutyrate depolymerase